MIDYPVKPNSRWSVLEESTGRILERNRKWPRGDGQAIRGQHPDKVFLLQVNDPTPVFDPLYQYIEKGETIDIPNNKIHKTKTVVDKSVDSIKGEIAKMEDRRFEAFIDIKRELMETRLMLGALLLYDTDPSGMPNKVKDMAIAYSAKATTIWNNRAKMEALITDVDTGGTPDYTDGWEKTPEEIEAENQPPPEDIE